MSGSAGRGGRRMADGQSLEFFRLTPQNDQVRVRAPAPNAPADGTTVQCQGQQGQLDVNGNGVWISLQHFVFESAGNTTVRQRCRFKKRQQRRRRERNAVDMVNFWANAAPATTAVVIIDMGNAAMLGYQRDGQTLGHYQQDVITQAQAQNIPIFEVYGGPANPTCTDLVRSFSEHGGAAYAHLRTFVKPGAGGANRPDCLERQVGSHVVAGHRERTVGAALVPNVTFISAIQNYTDVVVMGQDASICVGASIFGSWRPIQTPALINHSYERGILDEGVNVITSYSVLVTGGALGALPTGYTASL